LDFGGASLAKQHSRAGATQHVRAPTPGITITPAAWQREERARGAAFVFPPLCLPAHPLRWQSTIS
jgi:hypothetical protein